MRTEQLISMLAADGTAPRMIAPRLLGLAGPVLLAAGLVAISILGVRPGLLDALLNPVTLTKWVFPLTIGVSALIAALTLSRPQARRTPTAWIAAAVGAFALIWLIVSAMLVPADSIWPVIKGQTALTCVITVVLTSLPALGLTLMVLRDGASPDPARSGALAGLAVGGFAAMIYAFRCDQDQPLFFLTWYSLGILIVGGLGWLAGRRLLRW